MKDGAESDRGKGKKTVFFWQLVSLQHWEEVVPWTKSKELAIVSMPKHWGKKYNHGWWNWIEMKILKLFFFLEDTVISSLLWLAFRFGKKARGLVFVTPPPFWAIRGGRSNFEESRDCSGAKECFLSSSDWIFSSRLFESELSTELLTFSHRLCVIWESARSYIRALGPSIVDSEPRGVEFYIKKKKKSETCLYRKKILGLSRTRWSFVELCTVCSEGNPTPPVSSCQFQSRPVWIMFRPTGYCFIWLNKCEIQKGKSHYVIHIAT